MRLIYERGGEKIAFPIDDGETYIGRKEDCDIYFPDGSLSKRHARLVRNGGGLVLHDAGSRNGTLHNGKLVQGPIHLKNGDVIQCGKLEFRVEGVSGDAEFEMVDEESERGEQRGSRAAVMRGSAVGSATSTPVAKAVKSGEVRPSVLDEFPEVPGDAPADGAAAAPPKAPAARLRLVEGGPERIFELNGETVTIGSKPENAIVLGGDGISRYHAEVAREGAVWVLKDLGARNGLFVAGKKIDLHELKEGDEVQIGTNKLRFEVVKPSAMAGVAEIVAALKADPVGTFKKDQRVRTGAAATVVALILLMFALPGGGGGGGGGKLDLMWAEEGTRLLVSGDYKGAREIFRKAQAKVPSDQQDLPRALTELSTQWCEYPNAANKKDPLQFRWQKAEERLLICLKLPTTPKSTLGWLEGQLGTVRTNREAYDKLVEAEGLGAAANALAEQKKYREALKGFEATVNAFNDVSPASAFGARAAEASKNIREQIFALVVTDVKGRMSAAQPEWTGIIKCLADSQIYAETNQQADMLRAFRSECEQNRQCEVWYQRSVDIVNGRDVNNYQTALRLLEAVTKSGPQIRISPDAQAYYQWIQADLDVRQAQRHYENGDERRAFMLLDKAMQFEVLGPEARNSVKTRKTSWKRVVTAFNEGMRLYEQGTADPEVRRRAQEEFERVLQLEPNAQNRYHVRAKNLLQGIKDGQRMTLEARLESGLNAVQNREWSGAFEFFSQVMADPNHKPAHEQQMRNSVVEVAKKGQLVKQAKNDFTNGREERYLNIYAAMKLLRQWLPPNHKDREDCEKLYQDTLSFLKRQQRLAGGNKPR